MKLWLRKHWRYFSYIVRHKFFVAHAGGFTEASFYRRLKHDWSKLLPGEWRPYADHFHGKPKDSHAYKQSWLKHQHRNDHHWQHWVVRNDDGTSEALEMPEECAREMVADWMGAGRAITGKWSAKSWYAGKKDHIVLHPKTRAFVEKLLSDMADLGVA